MNLKQPHTGLHRKVILKTLILFYTKEEEEYMYK